MHSRYSSVDVARELQRNEELKVSSFQSRERFFWFWVQELCRFNMCAFSAQAFFGLSEFSKFDLKLRPKAPWFRLRMVFWNPFLREIQIKLWWNLPRMNSAHPKSSSILLFPTAPQDSYSRNPFMSAPAQGPATRLLGCFFGQVSAPRPGQGQTFLLWIRVRDRNITWPLSGWGITFSWQVVPCCFEGWRI